MWHGDKWKDEFHRQVNVNCDVCINLKYFFGYTEEKNGGNVFFRRSLMEPTKNIDVYCELWWCVLLNVNDDDDDKMNLWSTSLCAWKIWNEWNAPMCSSSILNIHIRTKHLEIECVLRTNENIRLSLNEVPVYTENNIFTFYQLLQRAHA